MQKKRGNESGEEKILNVFRYSYFRHVYTHTKVNIYKLYIYYSLIDLDIYMIGVNLMWVFVESFNNDKKAIANNEKLKKA